MIFYLCSYSDFFFSSSSLLDYQFSYPVKVPEFNKLLKKARGHISQNVVEITIMMKTIVQKPLMIKINKLRLRNLDN